MARPRTVDISNKTTKGIDIVMAVDVSGSMLAKDLKPNRMEALKRVAADFADERPNDRIGLWFMLLKPIQKHQLPATKRCS
jgi:Ca-activated chloride channel family protein